MSCIPIYKNVDVLNEIISNVDDETLATLVLASKELLRQSVFHVLKRMRNDAERFEKFRSYILLRSSSMDAINKLALKTFGVKIHSLPMLHVFTTDGLRILSQGGFCDVDRLTWDVRIQINSKEFKHLVGRLPSRLLYSIWKRIFQDNPTTMEADTDNEIATYKDMAVLRVLTSQVLFKLRKKLVINERFILKCFIHKLYGILYQLVQQQEFYVVDTRCKNLTDTVILMAMELDCFQVVYQLVSHIRMEHVAFALKWSTQPFLIALFKERAKIPDFDKTIYKLLGSKMHRTLKEQQFLEYYQSHRLV